MRAASKAVLVTALALGLPARAEVRLACDAVGGDVAPPSPTESAAGARNFRKLTTVAPWLRASGSSEFTEESLRGLLDPQHLGGEPRVTIVDLREELHGIVHAGDRTVALSWRGAGTDEEGRLGAENWLRVGQPDRDGAVEKRELAALVGHPIAVHSDARCALPDGNLTPDRAESEAALVARVAHQLGERVEYLRLPVLDHAGPDDDALIDRFAEQVAAATRDGMWLHLHCRDGQGRTTTFLALLDMIVDAQTTSFDDIVVRQGPLAWPPQSAYPGRHGLGGQRLDASADTPQPARERSTFLRDFYAWAHDPANLRVDGKHRVTILRPWSAWARAHHKQLAPITRARALEWLRAGAARD